MTTLPSLEDQLMECGIHLTAARNRGDLPALVVLEARMDRLLDHWLKFYPVPDKPTYS